MDQFNVYKDMKARTNGEIYIGVVGRSRQCLSGRLCGSDGADEAA